MSFGDLTAAPIPPPSGGHTISSINPLNATSPHETELQRLLKPFALNNTALRETSAALSATKEPSTTVLKRVRALRAQNRNIATAATALVSSTLSPSEHTDANARLQPLLREFADVLVESVNAERSALKALQRQEAKHQRQNQQYEQYQNDLPKENRNESQPLLQQSVNAHDHQPMYRAIDMETPFASERQRELSQIQSSVEDVNAIFRDLAVMVEDQSSQIQYVDIAVEESAVRIDGARAELAKTQRRKTARKSIFFCTLFFIAFLFAVVLLILAN